MWCDAVRQSLFLMEVIASFFLFSFNFRTFSILYFRVVHSNWMARSSVVDDGVASVATAVARCTKVILMIMTIMPQTATHSILNTFRTVRTLSV